MNIKQTFNTLAYLTNTIYSTNDIDSSLLNSLNEIKPLIENKNDLISVLVMNDNISVSNYNRIRMHTNNIRFIEEELILDDFNNIFNGGLLLNEEIANVSGPMVSTDTSKILNSDAEKYKKRFPAFEVNSNVFTSLTNRKVLGGINLESYDEKMLYNFSKNNPSKPFVIKHNNKVKMID